MIVDGALQGIDYVLGCNVMNQLEFGGGFLSLRGNPTGTGQVYD